MRTRISWQITIVLADAGMPYAADMNALEDAGYAFVVGSRLAKARYDLAEHVGAGARRGADPGIGTGLGTGSAARSRRIVYQYRFEPRHRDDRTITAMVENAEKGGCRHEAIEAGPVRGRAWRVRGGGPGTRAAGPPAR